MRTLTTPNTAAEPSAATDATAPVDSPLPDWVPGGITALQGESASDATTADPMEGEMVTGYAPLAILTHADVDDAITAGHWTHANPSIALWLNSAFIPATRDASALIEDLQAHGIAVTD